MIQCTKILKFEAAHRIIGHQGKCKMLHGHSYVIELSFESEELDELGMVVDFSIIKKKLKSWIDKNWDHNVILNIEDKVLGGYIKECLDQEIYYMNGNPTAENMASHLLYEIVPVIFQDQHIKCTQVILRETQSCYVKINLSDK
ncbi:MAG: 6-pyruvoyltetrahydropterin/6-carboxytetrahydropterin synthase [Candidatus Midichloriaceae bacterium]|jgi:6-pyruvoyltetrahydropterin/6-carboxytetrahydropterin synthase